ncbi:MAG: hypothetical protein ACKOCD_11080 [Nitrospiraceae bacterium]
MVTLFVITAGLLILFVYGLTTLSGMTPKVLYPLLRIKQPDGQLRPLVIGAGFRSKTRQATTPCQCHP